MKVSQASTGQGTGAGTDTQPSIGPPRSLTLLCVARIKSGESPTNDRCTRSHDFSSVCIQSGQITKKRSRRALAFTRLAFVRIQSGEIGHKQSLRACMHACGLGVSRLMAVVRAAHNNVVHAARPRTHSLHGLRQLPPSRAPSHEARRTHDHAGSGGPLSPPRSPQDRC